jgi:hypothetical protein
MSSMAERLRANFQPVQGEDSASVDRIDQVAVVIVYRLRSFCYAISKGWYHAPFLEE